MISIQSNIMLAARDNGSWVVQALIFGGLLLMSLIGGLMQKAKRQKEEAERVRQDQIRHRERLARQGNQPQQAAARSQRTTAPAKTGTGGSVGEIVQAMRQAARGTDQKTPSPPLQRKVHPPLLQQTRKPAASQPLTQRRLKTSAQGKNVDAEAARMSQRINDDQKSRTRRLSGGRPVQSAVARVKATPSVLGVQFDAAEARRAIIYSEIINSPLALRKQTSMWDS